MQAQIERWGRTGIMVKLVEERELFCLIEKNVPSPGTNLQKLKIGWSKGRRVIRFQVPSNFQINAQILECC